MTKSLADCHKEVVDILLARGEPVYNPCEKSQGHIVVYVKGRKFRSPTFLCGTAITEKDGSISILEDAMADLRGVGGFKIEDLGLCDSVLHYANHDEKTYPLKTVVEAPAMTPEERIVSAITALRGMGWDAMAEAVETQAAQMDRIKELEDRLSRFQEHHFIDGTPNGSYAMRILQSYRSSCDYVVSDVIGAPPTSSLCIEMNKTNELRKNELDAAISALSGSPCWQITVERVGLLEYCLETLLDAPDIEEIPGPGHSIEMLRAMLREAGQ